MDNTPKKEPSKTLIYVSNLPFETTDEQFKDLFKGFAVKTAYIAKKKNGRSKGFGFVNLEKESEQNAAIEKVNGVEYEKRKLIARQAMNDERRNENGELREEFKTQTSNNKVASETVVYVSNLAWTVNEEELKKIFAEFNPKTVTVATRKSGKSKGFGFVEFNNKEDQQKALSLDQKSFNERPITVKVSTGYKGDKPKESKDNKGNNSSKRSDNRRNDKFVKNRNPRRNDNRSNNDNKSQNRSNNQSNDRSRDKERRNEFSLYVKNLPFELDDLDLKDVFSEFHPKSARIAINNRGSSLGYGFVEFSNSKDQNDALKALDQSEINDRVVTIFISNPNRERKRSNRRQRSPSKSNTKKDQSTTSVYVSNLEFSVDDKALQEVFKGLKFTKAYVATNKNGRSKGFGFVDFASHEDQEQALKLDGKEVKGRTIHVQASYKRDN